MTSSPSSPEPSSSPAVAACAHGGGELPKGAKCPVMAAFFPAGTALQGLGLGLMVGGMTALGAVTTRLLFGALGRQDGGPLMTDIFMAFDIILLVALGLVVAGELLRWFSHRLPVSRCNVARWILLLALAGGLLYSTQVLNPGIQRMNLQGIHPDETAQGQLFSQHHERSESVYKLNLLLSAALLLLMPFGGPRWRS